MQTKHLFLLPALAFFACIGMQAQVTIGGLTEPKAGAVLDLNSTVRGGLLLSNVSITDLDEIPADFVGVSESDATLNARFKGAIVYNTNPETGTGILVWDGNRWTPIGGKCGNNPCVYYPPETVDYNTLKITTFTNVMYDFQYQTLTTYDAGTPVSYQWYAKRRGEPKSEFKGLSGQTSGTYQVPADFVKNNQSYILNENDADYNAGIVFACIAKYGDDSYKADTLDIEFIGTNTASYGTDANGVKYITLNKGGGGTFNVALLNLGQSDNNDAGDLGDFYQWGRVADGHQTTGWSKDPVSHADIISAAIGTVDGAVTSAVIAYNANTNPVYNSYHQVNDVNYNGKFITTTSDNTNGNNDWYYYNGSHDDGLWGTASGNSRTHTSWDYSSNDPCPTGWTVPSRWNFWDLYKGDGSDTSISSGNYDATNNNWVWRATSNNAVGGVVITNTTSDAKVFVPAVGYRNCNDDSTLGDAGNDGYYWSSNGSDSRAYRLNIYSSGMNPDGTELKALGFSVRCIQ
jgi:uncharacterized protein (TIGR02145 family)